MKKLVCIILAMVLLVSMAAAVSADSGKKLGDFSNRVKKASQIQAEIAAAEADAEEAVDTAAGNQAVLETTEGVSYGQEVRLNDSRFQKVRSSVFEYSNSYSNNKYLCMEIKNVSGRTIYPQDATIKAYNADGSEIYKSEYNLCYPKMVENGESFFVWESFFNDASKAYTSFEVVIDADDKTYTTYAQIEGRAYLNDGSAYVEVTNTTDRPIYNIVAVAVIEDETGKIVDIQFGYSNDMGILPGSSVIIKKNAMNHEDYTEIMDGKITAYVEYSPE